MWRGCLYSSNPPKDPVVMALISGCAIAGVGQMLMGQVMKGLVILFGGTVLSIFTAGLALPVVWLIAGIDAYQIATKFSRPLLQIVLLPLYFLSSVPRITFC